MATTVITASGRPSLYGHGLFGEAAEVASSPQRQLAQEHGIVLCATDEIGLSISDFPIAAAALQNLSLFPAIPDRLQQGLLDELYLGRAMISPSGFTTDAAFHQDGTLGSGSVLDTSHLFYNGNSQGGIMGGALTAVAPDFTRASLGVPAMNYSVLLPRSVDFTQPPAPGFPSFSQILDTSYPNETAQPLALDLIPAPTGPSSSPGVGRTPTSFGRSRASGTTHSPARRSTTGTPARSAKNRRGRSSASNRRPTKTFPTKAAPTRPACRGRRRPSSSSSPTSSKERSRRATTGAVGPASRSGSAGPSGHSSSDSRSLRSRGAVNITSSPSSLLHSSRGRSQ